MVLNLKPCVHYASSLLLYLVLDLFILCICVFVWPAYVCTAYVSGAWREEQLFSITEPCPQTHIVEAHQLSSTLC